MRRKKFSKERFYRRLKAQGFVKGGLIIGGDLTLPWRMFCCEGFPNLSKAAGKAVVALQNMTESIKDIGLKPPKITTISTNLYVDGFDLGKGKDFSVTLRRT
jgi:hypothetical protein